MPTLRRGPGIRVQSADGRLWVHQLIEGETTIGRAQAGLVLDDARISRRHACLVRTGDAVTIADLGSRNGTFVNGRRIGEMPVRLAADDALKVGDFTLVFEPVDDLPFAPDSGEMREVLKVAPVDVLTSGVAAPTPGATRDVHTEGLRYELEKKTRILGLFYELSKTLGSVFSLQDVHDKVTQLVLQVTPAARVVIYQRSDRGEMRHVASSTREPADASAPKAAADAQPLRVSRTVFDNVAQQRVSVLLENTRRNDLPVPDSLKASQTHSVMAAPIIGRKGLLGLIYADLQDSLRTFSTDDLDLLNAVAVQTGIAIDTVRAHEALQREAKAREKYERFLPQQLVDDVMLDPNKEIAPGGVRQTVTVLFVDLRGFTTLAEATTPEAVVDLLNRCFTVMSDVIFKHGGTLDKYIGDGVMALFGAPYSTERDAVKAVRAGIDIQKAVVTLNAERRATGLSEIGVGIGINTGSAIVGFIGSNARLDYTAIGDTVNTAARLEHLAKAGQIIISEHTMQAIDASVSYRMLDAVQVKGRSAKLQIAEVVWDQR